MLSSPHVCPSSKTGDEQGKLQQLGLLGRFDTNNCPAPALMLSCMLQGEARSYPPPQQLGRNGSQGDSQGQGQARSYPPPQQLGGPGGQGQGQARSYPPPQQLGGLGGQGQGQARSYPPPQQLGAPGSQGQGESNRGGPGQTSGQDRRPSTPGQYRPPSSGETLAALLTTDIVRRPACSIGPVQAALAVCDSCTLPSADTGSQTERDASLQ